eukprot:TRINITY_DN45753_c0_g1_i1.p1 TRINITY_DN45753_c0_g1~~TRINITY_DN45753_c0_g1_i1.p1  ORF type:complete len:368 (+),score=28.08 TRINITY_DN45753_c0_g1_i1:67-1170(+)
MPWAQPEWCQVPPQNAARMVVVQKSPACKPHQHDISDKAYYLLKRGDPEAAEEASSWHAAVLRNAKGDCFIMDLLSAKGTFMQGERLEPHKPRKWTPGTTVVLGVPPHHASAKLQMIDTPKEKGQKRPRGDGERASEEESSGSTRARAKRRRAASESAAVAASSTASCASRCSKPAKCDKCDGPHATDACPHFKKSREVHKDAWVNYGQKHPLQMGKTGGKLTLRGGRTVPQPGDGSCLFHSLCFGLNGGQRGGKNVASKLRKELANFIQQNPQVKISGDTLEEWVRWDANTSVSNYARRIASSGWGGGIEMAACSILKNVNVHVYERKRGGAYERISCFDCPRATKRTVHVLYQGGVHYDALVPSH